MAVALRVFIDHLPENAWDDGRREASFADLYQRCRPELVALCRRHLGPSDDAEAIAQEAFLKAWTSLDRYSTARPFWPWLATIARRLCIDHSRRRRREQRHIHREWQWRDARPEEPDSLAECQEERAAAVLAFKRLRPREQRLIGLREVDGWSIEQLARFEGISLDATRTALKRARAALRQAYEQVASGVPGLFVVGLLARARLRLARIAGRIRPGDPTMALTRGGELLLAALVVAGGQGVVTATSPRPVAPREQASSSASVPPPAGTEGARAAHGRGPAGAAAAGASAGAGPTTLPSATPAGSPPSDVPVKLPAFDKASQPEHSEITSFTVSPSYERDGTIFAAGNSAIGCAKSPCHVLFASHDRGVSWTRLDAVGYEGGQILLPPSYPFDARLFALGTSGLTSSEDGGQSFLSLKLTPPAGGAAAAISPGFSGPDPRIVVGARPGWTYDDVQEAARPADPVVPSTGPIEPHFAADVPDGSVMVVAGTTVTAEGPTSSAVFTCDRTSCAAGALLPGMRSTPSLALSPTFGTTGEAWAWMGTLLFRSSDGAHTFERVTSLKSGTIRRLAYGVSSGVVYAGAISSTEGPGGVFRSADGGQSWTQVGGSGVEALAVLPDGRLLVSNQGRGIACSNNEGVTWKVRCSSSTQG